MLSLVSKIIFNIIFSFLEIHYTKIIIKHERKIPSKKYIIFLLLLIIMNILLFQVEYKVDIMILRIVITICVLKLLYSDSFGKITMTFLSFFLVTTIADLINYSLLSIFFTLDQLRSCWYIMLLSNINVALLIIIIFNINVVKNKVANFIDKLNKSNIISTIIYFILSFLVIFNLLHNVSLKQQNKDLYIMNIPIIVIFIILLILLILDRDKYNQLLIKYDMISKYTKEFEDTIDEMELDTHERKNDLAILRSYIEENNRIKSLKLIEEMTNENLKKDGAIFLELKNIPKGGIKGLLYYKIMLAKQKNLKVLVQISKKTTDILKYMPEEKVKVLSRLIGVYLDNAIEASENTDKKIVSIEIYVINDNLHLVFTNNVSNPKIKLEDIPKKGYSTKGKGRGKGVYLVNKLVAKHSWITCKTKIINDYYIQFIEIKRPTKQD